MSGRQSAEMKKALALIAKGTHTKYAAARAVGLAPSTVYRYFAQQRKK